MAKSAHKGKIGKGEYDKTDSPDAITNILSHLKDSRIYLYLTQKAYQSGATVLVDLTPDVIGINKPKDWPREEGQAVTVNFKDGNNVRSYFTADLLEVSQDTLTMAVPAEIFRLQRRANFRIEMPHGSTISFKRLDTQYGFAIVQDLSAGGVRVRLEGVDCLLAGDKDNAISDIVVTLPGQVSTDAETGDGAPSSLILSQGKIVREVISKDKANTISVQFLLTRLEEVAVLSFVRSMEMQMLQKGTDNLTPENG